MKVPYTKNTEEARQFLQQQGFTPLSFFQGKEYVYPLVSTFANKDKEWKVYDYSTFSQPDDYHFFTEFPDFINEVNNLNKHGNI